jgi:hypothetical protein
MFRRNQFISIKYEDLIIKPINVLDRIEKKFAIDLSKPKEKIAKNEFLKIDHMIAGNGIRQNKYIVFSSKPRKKNLPIAYKILSFIMTLPFRIFYGYFW